MANNISSTSDKTVINVEHKDELTQKKAYDGLDIENDFLTKKDIHHLNPDIPQENYSELFVLTALQ